MVLVDTSVWIRFLANRMPSASELDRLAETTSSPAIRSTSRRLDPACPIYRIDVMVRDAHGKLAPNLKPEEIAIYEDAIRQDFRSFRSSAGKAMRARRSLAIAIPQV